MFHRGAFSRRAQEDNLATRSGFRGNRGTIDELFSICVALQKRKEHNLETWALFIDLVKAFDTVSREALFEQLPDWIQTLQKA